MSISPADPNENSRDQWNPQIKFHKPSDNRDRGKNNNWEVETWTVAWGRDRGEEGRGGHGLSGGREHGRLDDG